MTLYNIRYTDSSALSAAETLTRTRLLNLMVKNGSGTYKDLTQAHNAMDNEPTQVFVMYYYYIGKQYEEVDEVTNDLIANPSLSMEYWNLAQRNSVLGSLLMSAAYIPSYSAMLRSVTSTLTTYALLSSSEERIYDAIGEILSALLDYADALSTYLDDYSGMSITDTIKTLKQVLWQPALPDPTINGTLDLTEVETAMDGLRSVLNTRSTYPELVKFVLTPSLGSSGTAYITKLQSPIFTTVILYSYYNENKYTLLDLATPDKWYNLDAYQAIKTIDDNELQSLESIALNSLRTKNFTEHQNSLRKRAFHKKADPQTDEGHSHFGMSSGTASRPSGRRKDQKRNDNRNDNPFGHEHSGQESPRPANNQSSTPDDSTYNPDPLLSRLAFDAIQYVRALPADDMTNDHMTRFSVNNEAPQAISRNALQQMDQRIVSRDRYGNHSYLVTFTRRHRKPIFSPIN
jgi:hypothetical protein